MPLLSASLISRTASITTPAEFGESQTSSLSSTVERHVAERLALEPDVRPLAVGEPRHVVGGADVDVVLGQLGAHDRGDGVGLRIFFESRRSRSSMLKKSMLPPTLSCEVRAMLDAALVEQPRELAVDDRRADLRLDVVADDRQPGLGEALVPVVLAGDEHRQAVDEADARP